MQTTTQKQLATAGVASLATALVLGMVGLARSPSSPRPVEAVATAPAGPRPLTAIPSDPTALETHKYATRARPEHTFDVLSELVLPGQSTTQTANIPGTWQIIGPPSLAIDPVTNQRSPFAIEHATRVGDRYVLTAKNTGARPARLVADVPYVAWAPDSK